MLSAVARQTTRLHNMALRHKTLQGKYIFVKQTEGEMPQVCLIDAEGMRYSVPRILAAVSDLEKLFRHTHGLSDGEKAHLWAEYQKFSRLFGLRWIFSFIHKKHARKLRKMADQLATHGNTVTGILFLLVG